MNNILTVQGVVELIYREHGRIIYVERVKNLVTIDGFDILARRLMGRTAEPLSHMAIGDDNTAADDADEELGNETARVALQGSPVFESPDVVIRANFPAGVGTGWIREAGLFNGESGANLFSRLIPTERSKGANQSLTLNWTIKLANS